jgi:hypothetical protein
MAEFVELRGRINNEAAKDICNNTPVFTTKSRDYTIRTN